MLRLAPLAIVLALAAPAAPALAVVEVDGVRFDRERVVAGERLALRGAGLLRWRSVLRAYVAGLYLPAQTPASDALADVPKRIEIEYFWAIDAADFGSAAETLLREQLEPERYEALRERLTELHARYEPVEPGDRYALTYRPDVGTELALNDRVLALVPGADFAAAYFGLWLGPDPIDARLREQLLGGPSSRARERVPR